jgi:excisionase family DNA binding protein
MENEPMLSVDEVAERLRLGVVTVRRWLRSGRLKGVRIGSARAGWRIPESEVQRILRGER